MNASPHRIPPCRLACRAHTHAHDTQASSEAAVRQADAEAASRRAEGDLANTRAKLAQAEGTVKVGKGISRSGSGSIEGGEIHPYPDEIRRP